MADNMPHGARITLGSRTYSPQHLNEMFDVRYDDKGDLDRESFIVKVVNGRSQVIETLKPGAK